MLRIRRINFIIVSFLFFMLADPNAQTFALEKTGAKVTAMYLYNFLLFVDWPQDTFDKSDRITIVILGDDLLFDSLKPVMKKRIRGKKVVVVQMENIQDMDMTCHVLFIGSLKWNLAPQLLKQTKNKNILTVSDMEGFTQMGGMVLFRNIGDPTDKTGYPKRFEINLSAVKRAGLKIRSRLLRLSDIVYNP